MTRIVTTTVDDSLELRRVAVDNWVVHDRAFAPSDSRHLVGFVHETEEDELEVIWLQSDVPLPRTYRGAMDVLEDRTRWKRNSRGAARPVEIPHYPPLP